MPRGKAKAPAASSPAKGRSRAASSPRAAKTSTPTKRPSRARASPRKKAELVEEQEDGEEEGEEEMEEEKEEMIDEEADGEAAAAEEPEQDADEEMQDEHEEIKEEAAPPRRSRPTHAASASSAAPSPRKGAKTKEDDSMAQQIELERLVREIEELKGAGKAAVLKTLKKANKLLTDYIPTGKTSESGMAGIPSAHRPLLKSIGKTLVQRSILQHKENDVRVLTACCLSDVLRVFAPERLFEDNELRAMFQCFVAALQLGLSVDESPYYTHAFYLLEKLSLHLSPVLLTQLPSQKPFIDFVHALLSLLGHPLPEGQKAIIEGHVEQIVADMLEALEPSEISTELLDALLYFLTPQQVSENPAAFSLVVKLLDACKDKLERPMCKWVKDVLIEPAKQAHDSKDKKGKAKKHEEDDEDEDDHRSSIDDEERTDTTITKRSDQLAILRQLLLHVPDVLRTVHADLQELLTVDVESTRVLFTRFYAEIFQQRPELIKHMVTLFEELIKRFKDVSARVREEMAKQCGQLLIRVYTRQAELMDEQRDARLDKEDGVTSGIHFGSISQSISLHAVHALLTLNLHDKDDKVRALTIEALAQAILHEPQGPSLVSLDLLSQMGERAKDRKYDVRKEAIIHLASIFRKHIARYWRQGSPAPPAVRKFAFIPRALLASCHVDHESAFLVELAADTSLIGQREAEVECIVERTTCLLAIVATLEESSYRGEVEPHVALPLLHYQEEQTAKALFLNKFIVQKAKTQDTVRVIMLNQQQIVSAMQHVDQLRAEYGDTRGKKAGKKQVETEEERLVGRAEHEVVRLQQLLQSRLGALAEVVQFHQDATFFAGSGGAARAEACRYIRDVLHGLFAHNDDRVVEHLKTLTDCRSPLRSIRQAHRELVALIKSKGVRMEGDQKKAESITAAAVTNRLALFCSQVVTPIDTIPAMLSAIESVEPSTSAAAVELLNIVAEAWPLMLAGSTERLYALITTKDEHKVVAGLRLLSLADFSSASIKHSLSNKLDTQLTQLAKSGNVDVVRYAVRAIKALFTEHTGAARPKLHGLMVNIELGDDAREDKADSLLHKLFTHFLDHLQLTDKTLEAAIAGLAEVSSYYPRLFLLHRDGIDTFFKKQLFVSAAPEYHPCILRAIECYTAVLHSLPLSPEERQQEAAMTVGRTVIGFYIRTIVAQGVLSHEATGHVSVPFTPASEGRRKTMAAPMEDDEEEEAADDDDEDLVSAKKEEQQRHDDVLLCTANGLTDLLAHSVYRKLLFHLPTTSNKPDALRQSFYFRHLAFLAESTPNRIRIPFLDHVLTQLLASRLPFSPYAAIPVLAATLDEKHEFRQKVKGLLLNLVLRNRRRALATDQLVDTRRTQDDERSAKHVVNPQLPELLLADLIYLLSYHPKFDDPLDTLPPHQVTDAVQRATFRMYDWFLGLLDFFLDCVLGEKAEGNYSLLLAICSSIKNSQDVRDPNNVNLYKLADLVQLSVHRRSQHKQWTESISSVVSLPSSMFKRRDTAPKERYLPREYRLPERTSDKEKPVGGPATPRKRKAADVAQTPQSAATGKKKAARSPGSGDRDKKKVKPVKEPPTPSRLLPSRAVKSLVSGMYEEEAEEGEDDEEDMILVKPAMRKSVERPSSGGDRKGKENESAALNGRVLGLSKSGKLEARPMQHKETREEEEEREEQGEEHDDEEEDGADDEHSMEEQQLKMRGAQPNGRPASRAAPPAATKGRPPSVRR